MTLAPPKDLTVNARTWLTALCCLAALGCAPNVVTEQPDASTGNDAGTGMDAGLPDAGDPNAYPMGPYGVTVNKVIQNFTFPGYFTTGSGVKINTLTSQPNLDLQTVRLATDANGKPFRYLLLDISAGWCPPCNQEAEDLGLSGTKSALVANWLSRGGLFMTALVESYDGNTHAVPVAADIETWANQHNAQSSLVYDPGQTLELEGINPSAFPTNLVIDLKTMKIVSAWYGLDTTYQKWEAALNAP